MSNKLIKCSSCGFPLDAASASQNRIKCPKCGVVNVVNSPAPDTENKDNPDENIIRGLPVTEKWSDVHWSIVSKIIENHEKVPTDIFQELRITSAKRMVIPCYLFDCDVNFLPMKQVNVNNQSYSVKAQQKDLYTFSVSILCSGTYQDVVSELYTTNELTKAVNVDQLQYPSDVTISPALSESYFKDDIEKQIIDLVSAQAKTLVESGYYPELSGSQHKFNLNYHAESHQINLPIILVTFTYKKQGGEFYLSGDAQKIIAVNLPADKPLQKQIKQLDAEHQNDVVTSNYGCLSVFLGIVSIIIGLYMLSLKNWLYYFALLITIIGVPVIVWGIYLLRKGEESLRQEKFKINQLHQKHAQLFIHFLKKRVPLRGIWERSLAGKSEAFPDYLINTLLNAPISDEDDLDLV